MQYDLSYGMEHTLVKFAADMKLGRTVNKLEGRIQIQKSSWQVERMGWKKKKKDKIQYRQVLQMQQMTPSGALHPALGLPE